MKQKIIILDNNQVKVHVFDWDNQVNDTEDIVSFYDIVNEQLDLNLKDSECSWMIVDELQINIH